MYQFGVGVKKLIEKYELTNTEIFGILETIKLAIIYAEIRSTPPHIPEELFKLLKVIE